MRTIAIVELIVCTAVWLAPMTWRAIRRNPERSHVRRAPLSRLGFWIQAASYGLLILFGTGQVGPARLAAAMAMAPAAVALTWWAVPNLGRQWAISAGLYDDHELVRTGPYRYLRHPIYCSMLLVFAAVAALFARGPVLLAVLPLFLAGTELRVRAEDRLLAERFGADFETYRGATSAYLPFVR